MATSTTNPDPNANRTRVGGIFLTIGALLWAVGFGIYAFGIAPKLASGDDPILTQAQAFVDNQQLAQASGWIGTFADVFIAVGALFLVTRWLDTRNHFPASAFWLLVAVGAVVNLGADLVWGNAVVPVSQAIVTAGATSNAALDASFTALQDTMGVAFAVGFSVLSAGFAFVLFGETRAETPVVPNVLAYVGIAGAVVTIVSALGLMFGAPEQFGFGLLAAYLPGIAVLWLGVRTGFPGFMGGEAKSARRASKA